MILPYSIPKINLEVIKIIKKQYYNQEYIAKEISKITGDNICDICNILNALSETIINITSNIRSDAEVKICSGIKFCIKIKTLDNYKSNLNINTTHEKVMIYPKITDDFKKKINKNYKSITK